MLADVITLLYVDPCNVDPIIPRPPPTQPPPPALRQTTRPCSTPTLQPAVVCPPPRCVMQHNLRRARGAPPASVAEHCGRACVSSRESDDKRPMRGPTLEGSLHTARYEPTRSARTQRRCGINAIMLDSHAIQSDGRLGERTVRPQRFNTRDPTFAWLLGFFLHVLDGADGSSPST